jgi:hypothetical protein
MTALIYGVPKGVRTPVTAVKGQCPRPLDDGDRTADLLHAMQALSQLSYGPSTQTAHSTTITVYVQH